MKDWTNPTIVTCAQIAFGIDALDHMPIYEDIPKEFKELSNPWVKWQQKWFFTGLALSDIPKAKKGIHRKIALNHLSLIQKSFEPKHEHKEAAVAYLASLWFEDLSIRSQNDVQIHSKGKKRRGGL